MRQDSLLSMQNAVIVETNPQLRSMIVEVAKATGCPSVHPVPDAKSVLSLLEIETDAWVIMPALLSQKVNALHVLKVISENPQLKSVRLSLFVDVPTELYCLPSAFELGLLSWHEKSCSKESVESELSDLATLFQIHKGDATLVAAEYIRSMTTELALHQSRMVFERNLLDLYPAQPKILLGLAEAQYVNYRMADADHTLQQVMLLKEKLIPQCKRLKKKYTGSEEFAEEKSSKFNAFGIKNCVIVDPDSANLHYCESLLKKLGIRQVECFEDGASAWAWIEQHPEPGLLIQEWRVPELSGPLLIQRIRAKGYFQVPIIVLSSLIKGAEIPLLKEMGIDQVLKKPFEHEDFLAVLTWTVQQNNKPTEQKTLEMRIRRLLQARNLQEAKRLIGPYMVNPEIQQSSKLIIEAEFAYAQEDFRRAQHFATKAYKISNERHLLLNLIGKCLLRLGHYERALKFLEKANEVTPLNIERILNIADANLQMERFDEAKISIEQAKALDPTRDDVLECEGRWALDAGMAERAKEIMGELESSAKILSYMNARAVGLARTGRFEEAIRLYRRALASLPQRERALHSAVQYNLGLAFARYGDLENALLELRKIESDNETLKAKVCSLARRIQHCIHAGTFLNLQNAESSETEDPIRSETVGCGAKSTEQPQSKNDGEIDYQAMIRNLEVAKGELCAYQVFFHIEGPNEECQRLLRNPPPFKLRKAIERAESLPDLRSDAERKVS